MNICGHTATECTGCRKTSHVGYFCLAVPNKAYLVASLFEHINLLVVGCGVCLCVSWECVSPVSRELPPKNLRRIIHASYPAANSLALICQIFFFLALLHCIATGGSASSHHHAHEGRRPHPGGRGPPTGSQPSPLAVAIAAKDKHAHLGRQVRAGGTLCVALHCRLIDTPSLACSGTDRPRLSEVRRRHRDGAQAGSVMWFFLLRVLAFSALQLAV